jgi:hypothetical protein
MSSLMDVLLSREVFVLAALGFLAFYIACSLGARARWFTLRSVLCGLIGGLIGVAVGVGAALI